jgi:hypothetical protein
MKTATPSFKRLLESCHDYDGFSLKPQNKEQAVQAVNAFIKEFLEGQIELFYDDFFIDYYNLIHKYKPLAENWDKKTPFSNVLKNIYELETGQVQYIALASLGREGLLDDTKPTKHEAARMALKNNEKAMQEDNKAFYAGIQKSTIKESI